MRKRGVHRITEPIFYYPKYRDENALTFAFLKLIERVDSKIRKSLFEDCSIEKLNFKSDFDTEFQYILRDGSKPDGILIDDTKVICFENKVDQEHEVEQLTRYYEQMQASFKDLDIYILIGIDTSIQSRLVAKSILGVTKIPEDSAFILSWQEMYLSCKKLIEDANEKTGELDLFLLEEFAKLLEEMNIIPYTKLTPDDLKGFTKTRNQLSTLQEHLNQEIPRLLPQLQLYNKRNSYSSIFADLLGFQIKGASGDGYSYVYLIMYGMDEAWEIGISIEEEKDRKKLMKKLDVDMLIEEFSKIGSYHLRCGYNGDIEVEPSDIKEFLEESSDMLEEHLEIYRPISFEMLKKEYGLETSDFPQKITEEILNLQGFIELISSILQ